MSHQTNTLAEAAKHIADNATPPGDLSEREMEVFYQGVEIGANEGVRWMPELGGDVKYEANISANAYKDWMNKSTPSYTNTILGAGYYAGYLSSSENEARNRAILEDQIRELQSKCAGLESEVHSLKHVINNLPNQ